MKKAIIVSLLCMVLAGCGSVEKESDKSGKAAGAAESGTAAVTREEPKREAVPEETDKPAADTAAVQTEVAEEAAPAETDMPVEFSLWVSEDELTVGEDDPEVIFYAEVPVNWSPESLTLYDARTNKQVSVMVDEADYEKYGGDIKGDAVYNCRFLIDTDIDTDPDVSEERTYEFYAEFRDESGWHRSNVASVWVLEQFTDKEFDDMETVDAAIGQLRETEGFGSLATEEKAEKVKALLEELADDGLVVKESIYITDDMVTYTHACGISAGIKLEPFDPRFN
ncbi:MAG: hypothetical protein IJ737_07875 [Ruminococcus sp.]|nr:hypothetical protein [Ruminococcus sp.]